LWGAAGVSQDRFDREMLTPGQACLQLAATAALRAAEFFWPAISCGISDSEA
jgi:hypothetical protein